MSIFALLMQAMVGTALRLKTFLIMGVRAMSFSRAEMHRVGGAPEDSSGARRGKSQ